jgi:hypothetical protein
MDGTRSARAAVTIPVELDELLPVMLGSAGDEQTASTTSCLTRPAHGSPNTPLEALMLQDDDPTHAETSRGTERLEWHDCVV